MAIITQNGDYTVKLYNSNGSVISDNYKLSQIIADIKALGYDCNALTLHQYSSYGYGSLMAFKVADAGLYYVGDNDLKSGLGSNATLFQKANITFNSHYYTYTSGSPVDRGSISLSSQTVNGIEYYYDYDGNVANEPIIYVDSSISLVTNDNSSSPSGGAGSGYIGNSLVSNKKMVGYKVPPSDDESTKTESTNEYSENPVSGKPKAGNGFAKIKLVREAQTKTIQELAKTSDFSEHKKTTTYSTTSVLFASTMSNLSQYYKSDWVLVGANDGAHQIGYADNEFSQTYTQSSSGIAIPIPDNVLISKVSYDLKMPVRNGDWDSSAIQLIHIESGSPVEKFYKRYKKSNSSISGGEEVDNDYHTYTIELDTPVSADYFYIGVGNTSCYVKNIKLTVI